MPDFQNRVRAGRALRLSRWNQDVAVWDTHPGNPPGLVLPGQHPEPDDVSPHPAFAGQRRVHDELMRAIEARGLRYT
jgi:hypothetical protein